MKFAATLCFAPLDAFTQKAPNTIELLAVGDRGFQYPADPLERLLDKYCIEGQSISAADLAEVPDDRGEFVEAGCRQTRQPTPHKG